ncbi:MAG: ABC transporter ATP-binding protein [Gemmatimonadetes bacterium]|nr:ABC transporter ATP-binding protein [Gemmatimonadota bacterium]
MIELNGIDKTYERSEGAPVQALAGIDLSIQSGEFVSVVGASGSGKSTLMNIMGLLDQPTKGSYRFDQREIGQFTVDELAQIRNERIGFVFQSFHLLARTSALENVELPLIYSSRREFRSLAEKALKAVGLEDRSNHFPSELSGGQQQRVAIARALVNEPDILFADEPTGNLDSQSGGEIIEIFKELNEQGKTVILVTHDEGLAQNATRIVRLSDGRIVEDRAVEGDR